MGRIGTAGVPGGRIFEWDLAMRRMIISVGIAALLGLAVVASPTWAQGGMPAPPPETPEQQRLSKAQDRAQLEIAALQAKIKLAQAEVLKLSADSEIERVKALAREKGYPELALSLAMEKAEPLDPVTLAILDMLDRPVSMPFAAPTPLEDVIKYVKSVTQSEALPAGIPIYVDPVGMQEADKTEADTVQINLEGVALGKSLRLVVKQLGLAYSVKDGLLTLTSEASLDDEPDLTQARRRLSGGPDPAIEALDRVVPLDFPQPTALVEVFAQIAKGSAAGRTPSGAMIVVDAKVTAEVAAAKVAFKADGQPLKASMTRILEPLGLTYTPRGGMILVRKADPVPPAAPPEVKPAKPPKP